ncbi:hypothetical protein D3C78_1832540 [compost metagenome]
MVDCRVVRMSVRMFCTPGKVLPLNWVRPLFSSTRLLSRLLAMRSSGSLLNLSTIAWKRSCSCSRLLGTVGICRGRAVISNATLSALG